MAVYNRIKKEPEVTSQYRDAVEIKTPSKSSDLWLNAKNSFANNPGPLKNPTTTAPASTPRSTIDKAVSIAKPVEPKATAPKVSSTSTAPKTVTSDEVFDMFKSAGLYDTIENIDFGLIIANPEYGLKLLDAKKRYGEDGISAAHRDAIAADFNNIRQAEINSQKPGQTQQNGGKTDWQGVLDTLIASYANNKFSYDAKSDPRYALAEEYAQNAMKNQMAESAMLSGGYGNSYAAAAGQGVYNEYMDNAAANLEADAYGRWQNEKADKLNMISMVSALEERDYNRAYQKERDAKADERYDKEMAIAAEDRAWNRALVSAEYGDFSSLGALGVNTADAEKIFKSEADYKLFMTGLEKYSATGEVQYLEGLGLSEESIGGIVARYNAAQYAEAFAQAYQRYQVTHNPAEFDGLGVDTSYLEKIDDDAEYARQLEQAMLIANMGDFGELEKLNIDTTRLARQWQLALTPSYSSGGNPPEEKPYVNKFDHSQMLIDLDDVGAYKDMTQVPNILVNSGFDENETRAAVKLYTTHRNMVDKYVGTIWVHKDPAGYLNSEYSKGNITIAALTSILEETGLYDEYKLRYGE